MAGIGTYLLFAVAAPALVIGWLASTSRIGRALWRLGLLAAGAGVVLLLASEALRHFLVSVPAVLDLIGLLISSTIAYAILELRNTEQEEWTDYRKLGGKERVRQMLDEPPASDPPPRDVQ